ncbi:MAG: hypothetical protein WBL74_13955 [Novosphingobium sp.]
MQPLIDSKTMKSRDKYLAAAQIVVGGAIISAIIALTLWRLLG